ncbi:MAG: hypothetical protein AAGD32_15130 [Planctomycetota bacterium]
MQRFCVLVLALGLLSAGCQNNVRYNAKKNRDLRSFQLVTAQWGDKPYQPAVFYNNKGELPYDDDSGELAVAAVSGAAFGLAASILLTPIGGMIVGGSMMAASSAGMAIEKAIEDERSKILQATVAQANIDSRGEFHRAFAQGMNQHGYLTEGGTLEIVS